MRFYPLAAGLFTAVALAVASGARAEDSPPSILEMLKVSEAMLASGGGAAPASAARPAEYTRAPTGRRVNFQPMLNLVIETADNRINIISPRNRHVQVAQIYERTERFPQAENAVRTIIQTGTVGDWADAQNDLILRAGLTEAMLASLAGYRQNDRLRRRFLGEAQAKFEPLRNSRELPWGAMNLISTRIDAAENLPEITRKAAELQSALNTEPNADRQYELAMLFARREGYEVYGLQFLRAALDFKYMYPSHPAHAEGVADDLLARAFIMHDLFQQALDHINKCIAEDSEGEFVRSGTATWRLCRTYELRGWRSWEAGDRQAGRADLQRALQAARHLIARYPESRWVGSAQAVTRYLPNHLGGG